MEELQSWEELAAALEGLPWRPAQQVDGATIYHTSETLEDAYSSADWYFDEPPAGLERYSLLRLLWDSSGAPISWDGWLEVLQVGQEAAYVLFWLEGVHDTPELVAKVVPSQTPAAYRALTIELMRDSENLASLPDHTYNSRPDLLDRDTVRQGYWEVLDRIDGWEVLRAILSKRRRGLVTSAGQSAPVAATDSLSEADRQTLLDRYFEVCYTETTDE